MGRHSCQKERSAPKLLGYQKDSWSHLKRLSIAKFGGIKTNDDDDHKTLSEKNQRVHVEIKKWGEVRREMEKFLREEC